ncbi:hypothetical protein FCG67_02200 [Rhodococcus oryzae]|uniref:Porin n=1 Tax=Rhodococcus oryzae TaxID=2571143 RepID=A0ABY2RR55_9NOCA|nr:hypothetical protein [Rhodococcus oryzae]TJZ81457.1 hypothetical protein FCG67_02200 [Rhodococcus oryzae]
MYTLLRRVATAAAATTVLTAGLLTGIATAAPVDEGAAVTVTTDQYRVDKEVLGGNVKALGSSVEYRTRVSTVDGQSRHLDRIFDTYKQGLTFLDGKLSLIAPDGAKTLIDDVPLNDPWNHRVSVDPGNLWLAPGWTYEFDVRYLINANQFAPGDVLEGGTWFDTWNAAGTATDWNLHFARDPIGIKVHIVESPFGTGSSGSAS